jgi:hypothetical protein
MLYLNSKVIADSFKNLTELIKWVKYWNDLGAKVLNYYKPISKDTFLEEYPLVFAKFYRSIKKQISSF